MIPRFIPIVTRCTNLAVKNSRFPQVASKNFTTFQTSHLLSKRFEKPTFNKLNWISTRNLISVRQTPHPTPRVSPFVKKWFVHLPLDTLKVVVLGATSIFLIGLSLWKGLHLYIEYYLHPTSPNLDPAARKFLRGAYFREEMVSDPVIAAVYLGAALKIASTEQNLPDSSPEVSGILVRLGKALPKGYFWKEAIEIFERAWKASDNPESQELRVKLCRYLGDIHMRLGEYQSAEKYLVLGMQISQELRAKVSNTPQTPGPQELGIMVSMADMYALQGNYEYALPLYLGILHKAKEYKLMHKLDSTAPIKGTKEDDITCLDAIVMGHLAEIHYGMKKYEEAISWAQKALNMAKKGVSVKECEECAGVISHNLGMIYENKGDKQEAFSYFVQAVSHATTAKDTNSIVQYRKDLYRLEQELASLESKEASESH
ncbi:hypothetical protein K7432_011303 [Basidiobolus ranarum]|uniref:Uncharacterized protein n=1 Tax=Basidiobolus ranarum TaxID=34480 RepID=A0ABR2VU44_9FUNG